MISVLLLLQGGGHPPVDMILMRQKRNRMTTVLEIALGSSSSAGLESVPAMAPSLFSTIYEYLTTHWFITVLLSSGIFMVSAYQELSSRNRTGALLYHSLGVFVLVFYCAIDVTSLHEWRTIPIVLVLIGIEVWVIRRHSWPTDPY